MILDLNSVIFDVISLIHALGCRLAFGFHPVRVFIFSYSGYATR